MKKNVYTGISTIIVVSMCLCLMGCNNGVETPATPPPPQPASLSCTIQKVLPHDTSSFTEGLLFYKGSLYESTGDHGRSKLLKIDLNTGKVDKRLDLDPKYFGEGIVILRDTIYNSLTWRRRFLCTPWISKRSKSLSSLPIMDRAGE